ncbi:WASH complex subunit 7 domain-containing protein [Ditylenchus destructor]|uniref:WASH complex subunit 7 domain-containing protein n=1 Tax=Ditylenchus destructor TaxID=166010 RepID=A0AAD4R6L9_9BILA|nr:WASH complex subunit 7 domain-containing protein [Ditylenchus destructor]
MSRVWRCLGDVLGVLVVLDEIVANHPMLAKHWSTFFNAISVSEHNPNQFDAANDNRLKPLMDMITQIDLRIMSGSVFRKCCRQNFGSELSNDKTFLSDKFKKTITEMLNRWDKLASNDMPDRHRLLIIVSLTILYHQLTPSIDKKLIKSLCATHRRIVAFHLIGDILWTPSEFLFTNIADSKKIIDQKTIDGIAHAKTELLEKQAGALAKDAESMQCAVAEWKAELKSLVDSADAQKDIPVSTKCTCVLKGARIADKISRLVKCVLNGYLSEDRSLPKSCAHSIFRLLELMNSVSLTFNFYWPIVLEWCHHGMAHWSASVLQILEGLRHQIPAQESKNSELLSALKTAEHSLCHCPTRLRLVICVMALEVANYQKLFRSSDVTDVDDFLNRLDSISNIGLVLSRVTDTSFLYWHRSLFHVYFEMIFEEDRPVENISLFLRSLNGTANLFKSARHCSPSALGSVFQTDMFSQFREMVLERLCNEIENDLRLSYHSHQDVSAENLEKIFIPPKRGSNRLFNLLQLPEFRIGEKIINVKAYVTSQLETTFYNLSAVALHDCETYTKMRILAKSKYQIQLWDTRLPSLSVDQGLDVLSIMRNIHVFVTNYNYDLNEQLFVEKSSKSRTLNVLQVQQVINSIKTHGVGILNSSVHFAYQFLKKKLQVFSQFLFDDQIKSILVKEVKFYRDLVTSDETTNAYPVKRAENVNNIIKKFGQAADGKTFLDKFRELITEIGNTVGFIRLFRAGVVESCAYPAAYLPQKPINDSDSGIFGQCFKESFSSKNEQGKHVIQAAQTLDSLCECTSNSFNMTDDYVEMLVGVFAAEFRNYEKFSHLRNFFIIVPPLTINFVEHIFSCRSRLGKRGNQEIDFTFVDDGFSMGAAYLLKLLNQNYFFDSLNWFESVLNKYEMELEKATEDQRSAHRQKDDSYKQSLTLSMNRIEEIKTEFQSLEDTLSSATIFFSSTYKNVEDKQDTEESFLEDF